MSAIFSVQNLQTFLRRKNFRPPSRGGPPGPERPPPPPPKRGRSPPERGPSDLCPSAEGRSIVGALVSSGITLLHESLATVVSGQSNHLNAEPGLDTDRCSSSRCWSFRDRRRRCLFRHCRGRGLRAHLLFRVAQLLDLVQAL